MEDPLKTFTGNNMGKKKKKYRDNTSKKCRGNTSSIMSKSEFIAKYCRKCGICTIATNATFCYDIMYKQSPQEFVGCAYNVLNNTLEWPTREDAQETFIEDTFCRSGACDVMVNPFDYRSTCEYIKECRQAFEAQVADDYSQDYNDFASNGWDCAHGTTNKEKKANKTKVKQATVAVNRTMQATFFTNGDDAWRESMKQAIIDEDNNSK